MWPLAQTYTFKVAYCWIWPKFGQKGQIFCFWSDGLFLLQSFREPYKVSFGSMTSSSGSYCDLQLILNVFTFRAVTHYIGIFGRYQYFVWKSMLFSYRLSNSVFAALLGGKATYKVGLPLSYSNLCFNWCREAFFN